MRTMHTSEGIRSLYGVFHSMSKLRSSYVQEIQGEREATNSSNVSRLSFALGRDIGSGKGSATARESLEPWERCVRYPDQDETDLSEQEKKILWRLMM